MKRLFLLAASLLLVLASCSMPVMPYNDMVQTDATPLPSANTKTLIRATILHKLNLLTDPYEQQDVTLYLTRPLEKLDCAVMFVQVFGIDIAGADSQSVFDDVEPASQAAAAFVVRNGLMNADSDMVFGVHEILSEGQFVVAVLRYLGYDSVDPSQAGQIAASLKLLNEEEAAAMDLNCTTGNFIDISYMALFVPRPGKYTCLFDDLAAGNIITNEEMRNLTEEELDLIAADMNEATAEKSFVTE